MNVDGDFEFYKFIWLGADQGWGVYSYPPSHGVKVQFLGGKPTSIDLKAVRQYWPRLKNKSVSEAKAIIGQGTYIFGKWTLQEAESICEKIIALGVNAGVVEVPNYSIVNMSTREAAQIRSDEIYDLVVAKLIENGGEIIPHSGIYPSGAIAVEDE